jgi:hypothetical protein
VKLFSTGDKVACIDAVFHSTIASLYTALPKKGLVYVVRDVPDDELHRYSIQVSHYRLMLERDGETGKLGDGWIVHLGGVATAHRVVDYRARLESWLTKTKGKQ